jgi:GNAT superfamily N-acetyltransferase
MGRRHNTLRLRERALAGLPPQLRRMLRRSRDRIQRIESRLRARLPERWGGAPVHVVCQRLYETDRRSLEALRPFEQAPGDDVDAIGPLEDETRFAYGVFVHQRLVAAGFCIGLAACTERFACALFAADYVHPDVRRRGLSHALHAGRLDELRRLGCRRVLAWVAPENAAAHASLRASGFVDVSAVQALAPSAPTARHRLMRCELVRA